MPPDNNNNNNQDGERDHPNMNFGYLDWRFENSRNPDTGNTHAEGRAPRLAHFLFSFRSRPPQGVQKASENAIRNLERVPVAEIDEQDRNCAICYEPMVDYEIPEEVKDQPEAPPPAVSETAGLTDRRDESSLAPAAAAAAEGSNQDEAGDGGEDGGVEVPFNPEDHSVTRMPCKHVFGRSCLHSWLKKAPTCPICRSTVESVGDNDSGHYQILDLNLDVFFPESETNAAGLNMREALRDSHLQVPLPQWFLRRRDNSGEESDQANEESRSSGAGPEGFDDEEAQAAHAHIHAHVHAHMRAAQEDLSPRQQPGSATQASSPASSAGSAATNAQTAQTATHEPEVAPLEPPAFGPQPERPEERERVLYLLPRDLNQGQRAATIQRFNELRFRSELRNLQSREAQLNSYWNIIQQLMRHSGDRTSTDRDHSASPDSDETRRDTPQVPRDFDLDHASSTAGSTVGSTAGSGTVSAAGSAAGSSTSSDTNSDAAPAEDDPMTSETQLPRQGPRRHRHSRPFPYSRP